MRLTYRPFKLQLKHPFGVSGHTRTHTDTVFVKLELDGKAGCGEACLPAYLGETIEGTTGFFEKTKPLLQYMRSHDIEVILHEIDALAGGNNAAKAAIDIALHDLLAKLADKNFTNWKGIAKADGVVTSYTIGIDSEEKIVQKIKEAEAYRILKIKAGTDNDRDLIDTIRKHTGKPLFVDVNQGWKNKERALELLQWMQDKNILLVEQPMPKEMKAEMKWLTERSPIPTFGDESIKRLRDLEEMDGAFSGVNIKLMKCTGLNEAFKMIGYCKRNKIQIMLGCMAESSCGTTAMAQLAAHADFVDLDAPQLSGNDPFTGLAYREGRIYLNNLPGIGAEPREDLFTV